MEHEDAHESLIDPTTGIRPDNPSRAAMESRPPPARATELLTTPAIIADDLDGSVLVSVGNEGSRKRQIKGTKRLQEKKRRYTVNANLQAPNITASCGHKLPTKIISTFQCFDLSTEDVVKFRNILFATDSKITQDNQILLSIELHKIVRKRSSRKRIKKSFEMEYSVNYYICGEDKRFRVCKNAFVKAIHPITINRLRGIVSRYKSSGLVAKEGRGGDRIGPKNEVRKNTVKQWIGSLRARDSHYSRQKSVRLYLPSSLKSITNLRKMYNSTVEAPLRVSYSSFFKIFVRYFNIGFASPASDTCTTCDRLRNQIRVCSIVKDRTVLVMQLRIHKLRAKAFYIKLKNVQATTYSIVYDLQQVHSLPKVTCQEAFYSRQLSLYNFGICDQSSQFKYSYTWTENQSGRGSNEIASAVHHYLTSVLNWDNIDQNVNRVRLVSDGCGGQNKNNIVLGMAISWLANAPTRIEGVELLFPVRGHSFLPCDRLFGRIEKELKTFDSIMDPSGFHNVFNNHCKAVLKLGTDWKVSDWKTATSAVYKSLPSIQEAKRIILDKSVTPNGAVVITTRCETSYNSDVVAPVNLLKRGKQHRNIVLNDCSLVRPISALKLKDIKNLLKVAYGNDWRKLEGSEIYRHLVSAPDAADENTPDKDCACHVEDVTFRV